MKTQSKREPSDCWRTASSCTPRLTERWCRSWRKRELTYDSCRTAAELHLKWCTIGRRAWMEPVRKASMSNMPVALRNIVYMDFCQTCSRESLAVKPIIPKGFYLKNSGRCWQQSQVIKVILLQLWCDVPKLTGQQSYWRSSLPSQGRCCHVAIHYDWPFRQCKYSLVVTRWDWSMHALAVPEYRRKYLRRQGWSRIRGDSGQAGNESGNGDEETH